MEVFKVSSDLITFFVNDCGKRSHLKKKYSCTSLCLSGKVKLLCGIKQAMVLKICQTCTDKKKGSNVWSGAASTTSHAGVQLSRRPNSFFLMVLTTSFFTPATAN